MGEYDIPPEATVSLNIVKQTLCISQAAWHEIYTMPEVELLPLNPTKIWLSSCN